MKRLSWIFAAFLVLPSCWEPIGMRRVAATQAPSDLDCPSARVSSYPYGNRVATEPAFRGCGRIVVYHCLSTLGEEDTPCAPTFIGKDSSRR